MTHAPSPVDNAASSPIFGEEHEMLRAQLRRFVDEEVKPHAARW